jgi:hypothetical protein
MLANIRADTQTQDTLNIEQETQAQICETGTTTWVKHNIFTLHDHLHPPYRFSLEATRL